MKKIVKTFHFLGGIYFAIFLIAMAAGTVVLGTLLEAYTDSHLYAAQWTYQHPLFSLLLGLFFINILFSALRRWPFRLRHLPFLITHLGLLMILTGNIIKQWYGVQGIMLLTEGGGSQQIVLPHTYALHLEKKEQENPSKRAIQLIPFSKKSSSYDLTHYFPSVRLNVKEIKPHTNEIYETWIKGNYAYFFGMPPLPLQEWRSKDQPLNRSSHVIHDHQWDIITLSTDQLADAIEQAYAYQTQIKIKDKRTSSPSIEMPLKHLLEIDRPLFDGFGKAQLALSYSSEQKFQDPHLRFHWKSIHTDNQESNKIALKGSLALYSTLESTVNPTHTSRFEIDVIRPQPLLLLIKDSKQQCHAFIFDTHGRLYGESFDGSFPHSLIVYDKGFSGYAIQFSSPFPLLHASRQAKEKAELYALSASIEKALQAHPTLAPPLKLLKNACDASNASLSKVFTEFLYSWHQGGKPLISDHIELSPLLIQVLGNLDWKSIPFEDFQACQWTHQLISRLEGPWMKGEDLQVILKKNRWPFLNELEQSVNKESHLFTTLAEQMFRFASHLPPFPLESHASPYQHARLLSTYFKAYGIEYRSLNPLVEEEKEDFTKLEQYWKSQQFSPTFPSFETPLTIKHVIQETPLRIEDQRPCVYLEAQQGSLKQTICLGYDSLGKGLKWPILNGDYLVRFQPFHLSLPYRIRLHQARQINYPDSHQPYRYEGDISILEPNKTPISYTLSMNRVYETWDGYRFYLSGLTALDSGLKRVQLAVNYDPAKYYLTYPGGLIVTLGIILLFWMNPYRKKK